jgi:hypothetical protein
VKQPRQCRQARGALAACWLAEESPPESQRKMIGRLGREAGFMETQEKKFSTAGFCPKDMAATSPTYGVIGAHRQSDVIPNFTRNTP